MGRHRESLGTFTPMDGYDASDKRGKDGMTRWPTWAQRRGEADRLMNGLVAQRLVAGLASN